MKEKINSGVIRTGETDIKLHLIDSFPNHPYHVFDDEDTTELTASIKANGLLNPIIVRNKADGRYELISGHRRKRAYEILKISKIRAIIVDITDDEAIIMMVDRTANVQRYCLVKKAFSYKMKLEAIKKQGKRNDLTCAQVEHKSIKSREIVGEQTGESAAQVARYIRLTELIPELLDYVDKGRIKMQPAIELSYLNEESQRDVVDIIDGTEVFPSFSQTARMRKAFKDGKLTYELVEKIMAEDKANQKPKYRFSVERLGKYMPTDLNDKQAEEYVRFKIDTPIGSYNPDWAVLWGKNGEQKLYFVIETKGTTSLFNLKTPEQLKIHCGMEHFKALDNGIEMHVATNWNEFKVNE